MTENLKSKKKNAKIQFKVQKLGGAQARKQPNP
jgi:hypothetical protein